MTESWKPRPYRVKCVDAEGLHHNVRVPAAIGEHDAKRQAPEQFRDDNPDWSPVTALYAWPESYRGMPLTWDDLKAQGLSEGELREWSGK